MTDYFALLEEPRRPWIEPDALKAKFLALSAGTHPDRSHGAPESEKYAAGVRYAQLNTAWQCLRDTKDRVLHLLELECGSKPEGIENVPADFSSMFMEAGQFCQELDRFLMERSRASSPMLRVQMFTQGMEWTQRVNLVLPRLTTQRATLEGELRAMNPAWENALPVGHPKRATALPLERLDQVYRRLSYVSRWIGQLQERVVQLSL
jgi:DnaJ-domain-containing protein 1